MTTFWLIITIIIVFLIFLIFSKLTVSIHYYHGNDNDQLRIHIKALYGLVQKKIDVPVIKVGKQDAVVQYQTADHSKEADSSDKKNKITVDDVLESIKDTRQFIHSIRDAQPIVRHFFKKVAVHEFVWRSAIGTRDASLTARLTGVVWSCKGIVQMILYKYASMRCTPNLEVTPYYQQKLSVTDLRCIVSFSVGNAIVTALKLIWHYRRNGGYFRRASLLKKQSV